MIPLMMVTNNYMSFEQYYDMISGKNVDMRPADVIMAEIDRKHAEARAKEEKHGT